MTDADRRLGSALNLAGLTLHRRTYRRWTEAWDHDHCAACWAKFSEEGEDLHEGWVTGADYPLGEEFDWVYPDCFGDLAPVLGWRGEG